MVYLSESTPIKTLGKWCQLQSLLLTLPSICGFYFKLRLVKNLYVIPIVLTLILWLLSNHILIQIRGNGFLSQLYIQLCWVFSLVGCVKLEHCLQNLSWTATVPHCTDAMTPSYYPQLRRKKKLSDNGLILVFSDMGYLFNCRFCQLFQKH